MAIYFTHYCAKCKARVVNDDKRKRYVHAGTAPENEKHKPVVRARKMDDKASLRK